jgi:bilirubin oxidase
MLRRPRAVIASLTALAATGVAVVVLLAGCGFVSAPISTVGQVDFDRPLAIPPLATPTIRPDGTKVFDLEARSGRSDFGVGHETPTFGYNGTYLGPTLRASRGDEVEVRFHNGLDRPTTVHWHGMHLPAADDGGPHQEVAPGADWRPSWRIDQPAATLWYHPHPHGETADQVSRGLAGFFLLDDPAEGALPLPHEYGVDDIPVAVQDVRFQSDGSFATGDADFTGRLGDRLLVDGTLGPYLDVTTEVVRLRLLDASPARSYRFAFADDRPFSLIASDGGLLAKPVSSRSVQLSPGERAEILVRMTPGERIVLRSEAPRLGEVHGMGGAADRFDVLQLRAAPTLRHAGDIPAALVPLPPIDTSRVAGERVFHMDGTSINDRKMAMDRIDAVVTVGTTEIWDVVNDMGAPHSFHVHDVQFRVQSIDGAPPPASLAGWKDTVYLPPGQRFRLVIAFRDYADADHPYMFHCHLLRHEDSGMMGQFLVVKPGQKVPATWKLDDSGATDDHHH